MRVMDSCVIRLCWIILMSRNYACVFVRFLDQVFRVQCSLTHGSSSSLLYSFSFYKAEVIMIYGDEVFLFVSDRSLRRRGLSGQNLFLNIYARC